MNDYNTKKYTGGTIHDILGPISTSWTNDFVNLAPVIASLKSHKTKKSGHRGLKIAINIFLRRFET